jgi:hypothetical protein
MALTAQPVADDVADSVTSDRRPRRHRRIAVVAAAALPALLYVVFVAHFGRNGIYWDDWTFVPIVDNALHHHLSFSQLWVQHNENRMPIAYALVAGIGFATHLNTLAILYVSVAMFIASFALLLGSYKGYAGFSIGPWETLILGFVWFSVVDTENALWAFQIAWYLVLLCLMIMLFLMSRSHLSIVVLAGAALVACIASYSSLQGLLLWPVGFLAIVWRVRDRRRLPLAAAWVIAAAIVTALYFRGFEFSSSTTGGGSLHFALHHPIACGKYILASIGNVYPTTATELRFHEIVGAVLLAAGILVVARSVRLWRQSPGLPLPGLLIVFALLFDLTVALGRVSFGVAQALSARYTMANLLIVIAVAVSVFASGRTQPAHRRTRGVTTRLGLLGVVVVCLLLVQIAVSTDVGLRAASAWTRRIEAGDTIVVNLDRISEPNRTLLFDGYVYPSLPGAISVQWVHEVEVDRLGELAPGTIGKYLDKAPPAP